MSHQRKISDAGTVKEPHSVSLKVLRLSRPSLSIQHPLPLPTPSSTPPLSTTPTLPHPAASQAYPSTKTNPFILSPLLTLPPAFGSAYVGETFSCTLCANNEVPSSNTSKTISNVRIEAEMKIPSSNIPTPLVLSPETIPISQTSPVSPSGGGHKEGEGVDLASGKSLQKIVSFDLKEEGSHVLAVTVTYSETTPTSGRVRTFRKLYQFVCKSCMVVRTKTGVLPSSPPTEPGKSVSRKWVLEAQLENTGEEIIVLDMVALETREGWRSKGFNWELGGEKPILMPGDTEQVGFLVEEEGRQEEVDGRLVFGVLSLGWRGAMGNRGFLSTGALGARVK